MSTHQDLIGVLDQLAASIGRSRAALSHAQACGQRIRDGRDDSGAVTIVIDDGGTARDIRVAPDWRRRLAGTRLGEAVVAADTDAATLRAAATAEALATAPDHQPSAQHTPLWTSGWLEPVTDAAPAGQRRSLEELSAAVWAAIDDLERVTRPPAPVEGSGAAGAVRVTMSQGRITGCVVDEAWLARQDEVTLSHALREAVSAAAAAGLAARAPSLDYQQRLREIIADARATIEQARPEGAQ